MFIRLIALLLSAALVGSACGSSSEVSVGAEATDTVSDASPDASSEAGSAGSPQDADATPTVPPASDRSSQDRPSPIAELLGIPLSDDDEMEDYFQNLNRQAEVKIAECMLAQGFEYTVVDYSQLEAGATEVDYESRAFAEQYGFGIASNPFEESYEAFENFNDPNATYVQSLGEGEMDAYQSALYGDLPEFEGGSADVDVFEPGGCQGEAFEDVYSFVKVFDEFGSQLDELEDQLASDPRIVQADADWSVCMSEAGFRYSTAEDAASEIERQYKQITSDPDAFVPFDELGESAVDVQTEGAASEEFEFFGPRTLRPQFQAQVDDLAIEERALAVASWDCQQASADLRADIELEYEQRFVDENGAAIRASLAG